MKSINQEIRKPYLALVKSDTPVAGSIGDPFLDFQNPNDVQVIRDDAKIQSSFNVMNGKPVTETFNVSEYRVTGSYGEAEFDREYFSSMEKSPDHLIFITGLIHTQKLLYLVLSKAFNFPYDPNGKERIKIWPTSVNVEMPKMVRKHSGVIQRLWVDSITSVGPGRYEVNIRSDYEGVVTIKSTVAVFVI